VWSPVDVTLACRMIVGSNLALISYKTKELFCLLFFLVVRGGLLRPQRRSIRLQGYDYSSVGIYFVTICTNRKECLLGSVEREELNLNSAGKMVSRWYFELESKFSTVQLDAFVCMPNHVHFLIHLASERNAESVASLSDIVGWFKTMTSNGYQRGVREQGWLPFCRRFWQRNYYEHIVRDEQSLQRIRKYIESNPINWTSDSDNPESGTNE
jgi:putative transposase